MNPFTPETKKTFLKRAFLLLLFSTTLLHLSAQDITFNVSTFQGGYNISCHGQSNGSIDATIVGGVLPYTYSWSNSATTQDISGLPAGSYTLTVTDSLGSIVSKAVTLFEPDSLTTSLTPSDYNGYGVSAAGAYDGNIDLHVSGGAPPYDYLWDGTDTNRDEDFVMIGAGTYSVTVTDQNGCEAYNNATLTQPAALTASIASYKNVSCYNGTDGEIKLTGSGGVPPYTTQWNNGSFTKNQLNIPAGDYEVYITDKNKTAHVTLTITITQPAALTPVLTTSEYPNGYNVECSGCANGTVTLGLTGGTTPMSYLWSGTGVTGQTTADLSGLNAGYYSLLVTDANGCTANSNTLLTAPFNGWDQTGNTGDSTHFIGTVNNAPLIFKSNNAERMRILPNGNIGIGTANPVAKLDVNGDLRSTGSIMFGGDKPISYTPAFGAAGAIFAWGGTAVPVMPECFPSGVSAIPKNQFTGLIELFDNTATPSSEVVMGWDGANGIIDLSSTSSTAALYLNHYCGKNVFINTGSAGGNVGMCTSDSGKVGIGTAAPKQKLDVTNGFAHFTYNTQTAPASDVNGGLTIGWNRSNGGAEVNFYNVFENADPVNVPTTAFQFSQKTGASTFNNLFTIKSNGNVGIGTDLSSGDYDNSYKLAVNGNIRAKKVVVETGWSDFVFEKQYHLPSLAEVEKYIQKNKHLPHIPSAAEIESNGADIGELIKLQMQKIEELTLYLIEQDKKIQALQNTLEEMSKN